MPHPSYRIAESLYRAAFPAYAYRPHRQGLPCSVQSAIPCLRNIDTAPFRVGARRISPLDYVLVVFYI